MGRSGGLTDAAPRVLLRTPTYPEGGANDTHAAWRLSGALRALCCRRTIRSHREDPDRVAGRDGLRPPHLRRVDQLLSRPDLEDGPERAWRERGHGAESGCARDRPEGRRPAQEGQGSG